MKKNPPSREILDGFRALGGTRTPNLLIRSQMLYPLSHERIGIAKRQQSKSLVDLAWLENPEFTRTLGKVGLVALPIRYQNQEA